MSFNSNFLLQFFTKNIIMHLIGITLVHLENILFAGRVFIYFVNVVLIVHMLFFIPLLHYLDVKIGAFNTVHKGAVSLIKTFYNNILMQFCISPHLLKVKCVLLCKD